MQNCRYACPAIPRLAAYCAHQMIEAGYSEKEAMEISGHRTRYVFERYHIVSERRLKEIASKFGAFIKAKDVECDARESASKTKGVVNYPYGVRYRGQTSARAARSGV